MPVVVPRKEQRDWVMPGSMTTNATGTTFWWLSNHKPCELRRSLATSPPTLITLLRVHDLRYVPPGIDKPHPIGFWEWAYKSGV